ncbi:MAG: hypothetical protein M3328_17345 [Chloroflexota bacterium]|nr:hypothetical protein [Chloroflexota bacterium]
MLDVESTQVLQLDISIDDEPQQVVITAIFVNIPSDGSYSLTVPGPDAQNTISVPQATIPTSSVAFVVNYPANFVTTATLNYWQGGLVPSIDANIELRAMVAVASSTGSAQLPSGIIAQHMASVY